MVGEIAGKPHENRFPVVLSIAGETIGIEMRAENLNSLAIAEK